MKNKLENILEHARHEVPYYTEFAKNQRLNSIEDFPVIQKNDIAKHQSAFWSKSFSKDRLISLHTSGSTGKPTTIYKSHKDYIVQLKTLWKLRKEHHGIMPGDPSLIFISVGISTENVAPIYDDINSTMGLPIERLNATWLAQYYNEINMYNPKYIMGAPSQLCQLLELYERTNVKIPSSIVYIEAVGEKMTAAQKDFLEDLTHVPVVDYYGCTEVFGIAYACKCGSLHIIEDNAYVEIMTDNVCAQQFGVRGNIVVTGLNSIDIPYIRYDLEDVGMLLPGQYCGCGNSSPVLEIEMGRQYERIVIAGKEYHTSTLHWYIEAVNSIFGNQIIQYKFLHNRSARIEVQLRLREGKKAFEKPIAQKLQSLLCAGISEDIEWVISYIPEDLVWATKKKFKILEQVD